MCKKYAFAVVWLCHVTLGCGSDAAHPPALRVAADSGPAAEGLDLPVPTDGFQVATLGHVVPAGGDQEWCGIVALPGDAGQTYYVGRTELAMTAFSHHLVVSMAPPGSKSLVDAQVGQVTACSGSHNFGSDLIDLSASAKPYSEQRLPDGIGLAITGGQHVVFDYHTLNTGDKPIRSQHRLNLHLVSDIQKTARTFSFYNEAIEIPAHTQRSFTQQCLMKDDLLVWSLTRHTHRRGTDFRVWWVGGEHDGELLWTSHDWEQDILYNFDTPVIMQAGTGFRWECSFDNPTDQSLNFGSLATDEMCILFGAFAAVGDDDSVGPQGCFILPR